MTDITRADVFARFDERALPYAVVPLQNDASIIVAQRGGRVLCGFSRLRPVRHSEAP